MRRLLLSVPVGIFAALATPQSVVAQGQQCGQRAEVVALLEQTYREARQGAGLARENMVVELYASAETGTWTILVTLPNGVSCLVASGTDWEGVRELARISHGA